MLFDYETTALLVGVFLTTVMCIITLVHSKAE
jgi:hypothetical protein